jgi:hypothetical protein
MENNSAADVIYYIQMDDMPRSCAEFEEDEYEIFQQDPEMRSFPDP